MHNIFQCRSEVSEKMSMEKTPKNNTTKCVPGEKNAKKDK